MYVCTYIHDTEVGRVVAGMICMIGRSEYNYTCTCTGWAVTFLLDATRLYLLLVFIYSWPQSELLTRFFPVSPAIISNGEFIAKFKNCKWVNMKRI